MKLYLCIIVILNCVCGDTKIEIMPELKKIFKNLAMVLIISMKKCYHIHLTDFMWQLNLNYQSRRFKVNNEII